MLIHLLFSTRDSWYMCLVEVWHPLHPGFDAFRRIRRICNAEGTRLSLHNLDDIEDAGRLAGLSRLARSEKRHEVPHDDLEIQ